MPVAEIHLLEGYSDTEKARLRQSVADAIRRAVATDPENVTVRIHDHGSGGAIKGRAVSAPVPAPTDPSALVLSYLDAMERRDLSAARRHLAPGFAMQFPGTAPMTRLEELIAWSKGRYRSVTKSHDATETIPGDAVTVVYTRGTLSGVWPDGSPFTGIRFIDRFEVTQGQITRQDVWNDLAEETARR